jgi:hypothetical protein
LLLLKLKQSPTWSSVEWMVRPLVEAVAVGLGPVVGFSEGFSEGLSETLTEGFSVGFWLESSWALVVVSSEPVDSETGTSLLLQADRPSARRRATGRAMA